MTDRFRLLALVALCSCLLLLPQSAQAVNLKAKNLFERGRFESADGKHEEALRFLDQAIELEPDNLTYQYVRGQVLVKLKRYEEAIAVFKKLLQEDPVGQKAANIDLAAVYAAQMNFPLAAEYYTRAMKAMPHRADLHLARGAVYLNLDEPDRAEADFREAAKLDPKMEALAKYHLARVSLKKEDYAQAKERVNEAMALKPAPALLQECQSFLAQVTKEERARKPWSVVASLFFQHNDNVPPEPLEAAGVVAPTTPTVQKEDNIIGFAGTGSYYFLNRRAKQVGLSYGFRQWMYADNTDYDLTSHTASAFYVRNIKPWYFRVQGDVGFYWADEGHKLTLFSVSPTLTRVFTPRDRTQLLGTLEYKQMHDGTDDARHLVLNAIHFHAFKTKAKMPLTARGGLKFEYEEPVGETGALFRLYEAQAGLTFPLLAGLEGDFGISYAWVDYNFNANIDPDEERDDKRLGLALKVMRNLGDFFRLELGWEYTYSDSSVTSAAGADPYEFRRNVYTFMVTGFF